MPHYQTINPANAEFIKSFALTSDEEVKAAIDKAHEVFTQDWRRRTVAERCKIMAKAAKLMRERREEFTKIGILEVGKTIGNMHWEVDLSADILDYYAKN